MSICRLHLRPPDPLALVLQRISRCLLNYLCSQVSQVLMQPARNNKRDSHMPNSSNNNYSYSYVYRSSRDSGKRSVPEWLKEPGLCSTSKYISTTISPPWARHTRSLALLSHLSCPHSLR